IADNSAYISVYYTRTGGVRLLRDFGRLAPPNGNSPFRAEGAVRVRQARTVIVRRALQAHLQNGAYVFACQLPHRTERAETDGILRHPIERFAADPDVAERRGRADAREE